MLRVAHGLGGGGAGDRQVRTFFPPCLLPAPSVKITLFLSRFQDGEDWGWGLGRKEDVG